MLDLIVPRQSQYGFLLFVGLIILMYMWYPSITLDYGHGIAKLIVGMTTAGSWFFYKLFMSPVKIKADQIYSKRAWDMGSDANYVGQTAGQFWTPAANVIHTMKKTNGIVVDQFVYKYQVKRHLFFASIFAKLFTKKDLTITPLQLTKGALVFGQMGAGKTVFFENIIKQNRFFEFFQRMLFHDIKGDMTEKFYRPRKDIILNPFDARAAVWDMFGEESMGTVELFFNAYMAAVQGKTKDFFTGSAKDRFMGLFEEIFIQSGDSKKKWQLFIDTLENYFEEVAKIDKGSEKDVAQTLRLQIKFFKMQNYLIQNGAPLFTLKKYFSSSKMSIFMLNNPEYAETLEPYFAGFVAAFTATLATKAETKNDFTLLLLDEYLSFLEVLPEKTVKQLHTLIRSKGGCLMAAIQYLPERSGEKNLHQNLMNSASWMFIFETTDNFTIREIQKSVGKVEYQKINRSASTVHGSTGYSARGNENRSTERVELLNDDSMSNMNYHHLTYCRAEKLLYQGYTPMTKIEPKNKPFVKRDLNDFYRKLHIKKEQ